jgi:two-component system cell cycle response regulator DivK
MKKILLVEDDEMSRDMLSRRLQRKGFNVVLGVDGEQGVTLAQSELPDIILMDMSLPLLDGWEATRRIKAKEESKSIPVIALTSHAMGGDRKRALAAGCDEYSTKPVDFQKLLGIIEQFI